MSLLSDKKNDTVKNQFIVVSQVSSTLLGLAPPLKNPEFATATFGPTGFSWEIVSGYVFRSVNRIRFK